MRAIALFFALALCLAGAQGARPAPDEAPGAIIEVSRAPHADNRRLLQVPARLPPPPPSPPSPACPSRQPPCQLFSPA